MLRSLGPSRGTVGFHIPTPLVVAGKHGVSEIMDLLLGSMIKHLLREAECDVLVVPPALEPKA